MEKENIHKNHRKRMREEIRRNGFKNMSPHRVLETMLFNSNARKDVNPLAHKLIETFGSFANVLEASYEDLMKVEGVGEATATNLSLFLNYVEYYKNDKANIKIKLENSIQFASHFADLFKDCEKEKLVVIPVNKNYEAVCSMVLGEGDDSSVEVSFPKIYEILNKNNCDRVVIMHNHPSGSAMPSDNDKANTELLATKLGLFGKRLLDHIIVASNCYYSFKDNNLIPNYEELTKISQNFFNSSQKH